MNLKRIQEVASFCATVDLRVLDRAAWLGRVETTSLTGVGGVRTRIDTISERRQQILGEQIAMEPPVSGRVLWVAAWETGEDGALEDVSDGFFDLRDLPPPWLWLELVTGESPRILAFVPTEQVGIVDKAIPCAPMLHIGWVEDSRPIS